MGLATVFVSANPSATVTFTFNAASSSLQVNVTSSVGVSSFQVKMEIPTEIPVGISTGTGFMAGATPFPNPPQYRWFNLAANGQSSGGLDVPLTIRSGSYNVNLTSVNLKDTNGNTITLDTLLPINLEISQSVVQSSSQSSSTMQTQIGTTSVVNTTTSGTSSLSSLPPQTSASTTTVVSVATTNMASVVTTSSSQSSQTTQIQVTSVPEFPRSIAVLLLILPLLLVIVSRKVLDHNATQSSIHARTAFWAGSCNRNVGSGSAQPTTTRPFHSIAV